MNTETIIAQLDQLNRWRRGEESDPQPDPKQVGEVIDAAIASLRSLVASNATLRNQRNEAEFNLKRYVREAADDRRAFESAQGRVEKLEAELASAKAKHEELRISYKRSLDLRISDAFRREYMVAENTALRAELARVKAEKFNYSEELRGVKGANDILNERHQQDLAELARAKAELAELRVSYEQNAHQCVELHRELASVKAERDEAKGHLDAIDDVMGKIWQRAHWQDCEGLALFFRHTLDLFPKTRNFNDVEQAVAALRQDKARLDWLEKREPDAALWDYVADAINIRAAIDAAMKEVHHG